jgi:hypothetical protein
MFTVGPLELSGAPVMNAALASQRIACRCLIALCSSLAAAPEQPAGKPYHLHSAMPAYWRYVQHDTSPEGVYDSKLFRQEVIEPNKEVFTAVAGRSLSDASLRSMARTLANKSEQLRRVDIEFADRLDKAWRRFVAKAPGLKAGALVFLLPAPRVAVGGAVRPLGERDAIAFGVEEIALSLQSKTGFDVLVHHEMTHLYHIQVNPEMRQMTAAVYMPPYAPGNAKLYQVVWLEGLAVYWSKVLNPSAPDKEVLVSESLAANVAAKWPRAGAELRERLDSSKKEDIDAFMFGGRTGGRFPPRTGYYIGSLIAEQLAKKYSFAELCALTGAKLQTEMENALIELEKSPIRRQ